MYKLFVWTLIIVGLNLCSLVALFIAHRKSYKTLQQVLSLISFLFGTSILVLTLPQLLIYLSTTNFALCIIKLSIAFIFIILDSIMLIIAISEKMKAANEYFANPHNDEWHGGI